MGANRRDVTEFQFTGFYWVLLGFTGFYGGGKLDFTGFYRGLTGFYWILLGFTGYH